MTTPTPQQVIAREVEHLRRRAGAKRMRPITTLMLVVPHVDALQARQVLREIETREGGDAV